MTRAKSIFLVFLLGAILPAQAQSAGGMAAMAQPAAPRRAANPAPGTAPASVETVTVSGTAARARGAAIGDVQPEAQLGAADVQSYGVSTVSDLLAALTPLTTSGAGNGPPIVLLNGRRISGRSEIRDIPTEAIQRVEVLPEEESLAYGFPPEQKVVNIVLLPEFRADTAELDGSTPTEGGEESGSANLDHFAVEDDNRLNFDLRYSANSVLSADARDLAPVPASPPYDLAGNVVAANSGQEIDPALSALAGSAVTVTGVPTGLGSRAPSLADFAATAGKANVTDDRPYRTLLPESHTLTGNAVWSRAFGDRTSATLNATFRMTDSESLRGLPGVALAVPAGDPFSPFASAVVVDRYVPDTLHQSSHGWTGHLGGALYHDTDRWHYALTGAYTHGYSRTVTDSGVDAQAAQAMLQALSPDFDPFGPLDASLFARTAPNLARSSTDSANLQALANGPLLDLPAGPLLLSVAAGDSSTWIDSHSRSFSGNYAERFNRNDASLHGSFNIPLTRHDTGPLAAMGDFSLNGNAAIDSLSDHGALTGWGYGGRWSPFQGLTVSANASRSQSAPSPQQLGNPVITATGSRPFDFATGQTVIVTAISGGNPDLRGSQTHQFRAGLTLKPFQTPQVIIVGNYVDNHVSNPIGGPPPATAAMQAALSGRFITGADGQLVSIDYRPINFAAQDSRQLRWGFNGSGTVAQWLGADPAAPSPPGAARIVASLYHTVFFEDRILIAAGGPVLDLLNGGAMGSRGGQARQRLDGDLGYMQGAFGAHLSFSWHGGTTIDGGGVPAGNLDFSGLATVGLRLFANIGDMDDVVQHYPWLDGSRVTFSVANLFDERVHVVDGDDVTPATYQPAYLDPAGRVVSLSLRKQFL